VTLAGTTIAFDLDGTLVDTAPDLIGTLNAMLLEHGLRPVPLDAARHLVGRGARHLLEHGFKEGGASFHAGDAQALVDRFIALYRDRIADESLPFADVVTVLDGLKAEGARMCICTNKRTDLSVALIAALGLSDRFDAIVGPDLVSAHKPSAAHLIEAVQLAGGDPKRCLMVGDSIADVGAAKAAGVPVVVVSFGYTETPAAELGADALIDSYLELPAVAHRLLEPNLA
jgi:phosphoglycolate phosphatase